MSEIRKDPTSSTWVILAPKRSARPHSFVSTSHPQDDPSKCPFCIGDVAAGTVFRYKKHGKMFEVTTVENKYPALSLGDAVEHGNSAPFYRFLRGMGGHEVIVETVKHDSCLADLSQEEIEAIIGAYVERYIFWDKDPRIRYVLIFRNHGEEAGASLAHPHSQLIALPMIPSRVLDELEVSKEHYELTGNCIYCSMARHELLSRENVLFENATMMVYGPYAQRFPFELCIMPKPHASDLSEILANEISDLAEALRFVSISLYRNLNDPPFNMMLHTCPTEMPGLLYYHWHIELIPRLSKPAGFEWGAGIYINAVTPEDSIRLLKENMEDWS